MPSLTAPGPGGGARRPEAATPRAEASGPQPAPGPGVASGPEVASGPVAAVGRGAFDVGPDGAARPAPAERPGEARAGDRWIHRDLSDPAYADWLRGRLPPLAGAAMTARETRPRCQPMKGGLLLNLRGVDPGEEEGWGGTVSVRLWIEPRLVVTAARRAVAELDAIRAEAAAGRAPPTRSRLVADLAGRLVSGLEEVTVALEDATDDIEEALLRPDAPPPDELSLAEMRR